MPIPAFIVNTTQKVWRWQWNQMMNELAPCDKHGNYVRPFRAPKKIIIPLGSELIKREKSQLPILIIGKSCPWAHRTWLTFNIKNLADSINLFIAKANHQNGRWELDPPLLGCKYLSDLYSLCKCTSTQRATLPILIDPDNFPKSSPRIISNESADIVEILNKWPIFGIDIDLSPKDYQEKIIFWQQLIQASVNNGVYKCGFARNQNSYESASNKIFRTLKEIDESLKDHGPWLCGEKLTIADIRLFPTLIRWETIYQPLFKCTQEPLSKFLNIIRWRENFFKIPKVAETCDSNSWREDYFGALFPLNPSNIIPKGEEIKEIVKSKSFE